MLSVFTTVVPPSGRGQLGANLQRIQMARAVLQRAAADSVQLVLFPAGFLRARDERDVDATCSVILKSAADLGVAVVFGVDAESLATKHRGDRVARGCLPFFVVAQSGGDGPHVWRQRSTTAVNGYDVPKEALEPRALRVAGRKVHIFACGEVFNRPLREALAPWSGGIVVVPTHTARGARFFRAVEWADAVGARAILRATHALSPMTSVGAKAVDVAEIRGVHVRRWG